MFGRTRRLHCIVVTAWLLLLVSLADARAAEPAGRSIGITVGYLSALNEHTNIFAQGLTTSFASDNIFIGGFAEAPVFWKEMYPFVVAKWMLDNRYEHDEDITQYFYQRGFLAGVGLGYGVRAWEATLRLEAAGGYWWEQLSVDYTNFGLDAFKKDNDQLALWLGTSLAFPFSGRVNALVSAEFMFRDEVVIEGEIGHGRSYRIETSGTYGTISIGLAARL